LCDWQTARVQRALTVVALLLITTKLDAQGPAPSPLFPRPPSAPGVTSATAAPQFSPAPELTKADVEAFLDALIPSQLQNRNMAGAAVSVVKDGQLLLAKGYGYADFAGKKPVIADQTLFRPGSISKLFTAIAVMQLVEKGQLDLDKDVNEYLDFQIPKTYAEPVTLRRLLTHTAGFEEVLKNLFVPNATKIKSLHDYLVSAMPVRIFPPGKIPAYSNYGLCLAGYIVERVSGEKFDAYIDNHVLKPLKMQNSTFAQPLPETLTPHMSNGYRIATKPAKSFEFVQAAPAGSLSTTATDMSRFMLAVLQNGTLEDGTILKPETIREMESRQFELHPELNGLGLVFFDYSTNGQRIVGHGGDTLWFHSDMYLLLDAHVGLFISYNSAGLPRPTSARTEVERAFLDRYFPDTRPSAKDVDLAVAQKDARAVSGVYQTTRRGETTLLKITTLFGQTAVKSDRNGVLTIEDFKNLRGELKKWRAVGPLIYDEVDGPGVIALRRDASGKVNELLPQLPVFEFQRVPWHESKNLIYPILGVALGLPILTVLCWPVALLVRKRYHRPLFTAARDRVIYFLSRVVCFLELGYVVILGVLLSRAPENVSLLGDGLDPWLKLLHILGWSIAAAIIVLIISAARFWKTRGLGWWPRTHATLLALSGVAFILIAWHWHLLDASTKF
jgi:CubicO group peptidase (beta-lactamase class C family)